MRAPARTAHVWRAGGAFLFLFPGHDMSLRAVLPVLAAGAAAYFNSKRTDERKAQIERTNDQVRLLYGPLLACVHATRSAYLAMVHQHSPDNTAEGFVRAVRECPEGAEGRAYR